MLSLQPLENARRPSRGGKARRQGRPFLPRSGLTGIFRRLLKALSGRRRTGRDKVHKKLDHVISSY